MTVPTPTALVDAWPLYGLRLRSERLVLRLPTDEEILALLDVAKAGIHPPDECPSRSPGRRFRAPSSNEGSFNTTGAAEAPGRRVAGSSTS